MFQLSHDGYANAMSSTDEVVVRDGRVLLGFMAEQEAQAFVASQSTGDWASWRPKWEAAVAAVAALGATAYVQPNICDLSTEGEEAANQVKATPLFQQQAAQHRAEIRSVEIDSLLVFQQFVDSQFSLGTEKTSETDKELVSRCFPLGHNQQLGINIDGEGAAHVTSLSRNVYVAPPQLMPATPNQPPMIAFPIVISPNWMGVAEVGGRYYLTNGYHRTWLLRHRGVTHVPAMVSHFGNLSEAGVGPGFFSHSLITSANAPTFKHFFDDQLAITMPLKSTLTILQFRASRVVLSRLP